ncbi:hypothetical protein ACOSQ4_003091 [Xanthoceras sorbifolium]
MESICNEQGKESSSERDQQKQKIAMECLPHEIVFNILSNLPISSLVQTKFVSRAMIENDPCLILHCDYPIRNQIYFIDLSAADNENDKRLKKFCPSPMNELYIDNPFTCDHLELPGSTLYLDKQQVFGFGFHPCTKEYKPQGSSSTTSRSIGKFPYTIIRWVESHVFFNGRLHWIFWPLYHDTSKCFQSMSIDLADEQLREVLIPDCEEFKGMCDLVVIGGCLSAVFYCEIRRENSWSREFYIGDYVPRRLELEPDVDPSFSLSKLYNRRGHVKMLCLLKSGEILMEYKYRVLVSYDPKSGTFKDLSFPGMLNWFETFVHVGSLNWIDTLIDM